MALRPSTACLASPPCYALAMRPSQHECFRPVQPAAACPVCLGAPPSPQIVAHLVRGYNAAASANQVRGSGASSIAFTFGWALVSHMPSFAHGP